MSLTGLLSYIVDAINEWWQRDGDEKYYLGRIYGAKYVDGKGYTVLELRFKDNTDDRLYQWHEAEYSWWGTNREKYLSIGVGDREDFFIVPGGGAHFGQLARQAVTNKNEISMDKATDTPTAPGQGEAKFAFVDDPDNPGKARLVAYAGTSAIPTVITPNIGDGY